MLSCGRIRKKLKKGVTKIIDRELENLSFNILNLKSGDQHKFSSGHKEFAIILLQGKIFIDLADNNHYELGPRKNPFENSPWAILVSREAFIKIEAAEASMVALSCSPAEKKMKNIFISPQDVTTDIRGTDNWKREVRKIIWSDNSTGNQLLVGETVTFAGNWSTMPPHRHQFEIEGAEAPYEEIYFFQFSHPKGFGMIWQFDEDTNLDQAFSLKNNDAAYMNGGYHPIVCAPGTKLYHLTLMAGPLRQSLARIHPDYRYIIEERNISNQYRP